ncbi:adenine-N(1)--methyltransferase-like protein [Phyllosticta citrichinensis]|uniref:tRNA (adenine(58)-N(1))-methyltransferase catalytic subunit TRM61 n=1 Tax=Phyllosticta citrichinensis TaxID=1130410 RepID=A0ABR1XNQ2_9PEZI
MLAACRPAPRPLRLPVCRQCLRSLSSRSGPRQFAEGDVVLLRDKKKPDNDGILTYALKTGGQVRQTAFAGRPITHDEIIGKRARDVIKSTKTSFRLHEPTLEEYVRLSPRIATPIYHDDANVIVGLMDIHVDPPSQENASTPPLEVLEAGTGHGGVTLHLARAIHAANPPLPKAPEAVQPSPDAEDPSEDATYDSSLVEISNEDTFEAWKRKRRAVVHTVEAKRRNMVHARQIVKHFRHGLYARHVDFHLGDVTRWIERRLESMPKPQSSDSSADEPEPFLSRVFLDLPASEGHLPSVARALQVDGILAVFNPSITQIADCLKAIKESRLPLALEHVAELRGGQTARPWEIKLLKETKTAKNTSAAAADNVSFQKQLAKANEWNDDVDEAEPKTEEQNPEAPSVEAESAPDSLEGLSIESATSEKWRVVCRPKLTTSNIGGFVGIFRKTSYDGQGQARASGSETDPIEEVNSSSE